VKHKKQYPGATPYTDRHGKRRWCFRKGGFSVELGRKYGANEFVQRYEAALKGHRVRGLIGADRTIPGSVNALVASRYRSSEFLDLSDSTQSVYRQIVEKFQAVHGSKPIVQLERRHVQAMLAEKAETPAAANNLRKRLIQLWDHAISLDWRTDNPARATRPYRMTGTGFHSWEEREIARFFVVHKPGSLAHLAVTLLFYAGAVRVDAVQLGPDNLKAGRIEYRRQKTYRTGGTKVSIPVYTDLADVLMALPNDRPFWPHLRERAVPLRGLGTQCGAGAMKRSCQRVARTGCAKPVLGG